MGLLGGRDQEPGRQRPHDARLSEAQRGALGRGEVPAEAGGEPGEEEARPLLKNGGAGGDRAPRAAGPGLQRAGPQEAPADSPAGVPGPAGPHRGEGPDGPAERRGQVLAPKPRSLGLVDFSQNTRGPNRYGLVVTDVFTREVATKALPNKQSGTVTQAAAEIIPELVRDEGNYVVTTDQGNEFRGLEGALPESAVHREKMPSDRNATAVIDRAIQTLKKDGGPGRRRLGRARGGGDGSLQRPAAPGGDGGAGGRGDEAGGDLPGAPGQRGEVRAQQEPDPAEAGAARAEGLGRAEGTAHEAARAAGRPAAAGLQPGTRGTALTRSVEKLQNQNPSKNCRAPEPA